MNLSINSRKAEFGLFILDRLILKKMKYIYIYKERDRVESNMFNYWFQVTLLTKGTSSLWASFYIHCRYNSKTVFFADSVLPYPSLKKSNRNILSHMAAGWNVLRYFSAYYVRTLSSQYGDKVGN